MKKIVVLLLLVVFSLSAHAGKIYKYTDTQGNIYYSEKKPFDDEQVSLSKGVITIDSENIDAKSKWQRAQQKKKIKIDPFDNFVMSTPADNKIIKSEDKNIVVSVNVNGKLASNYRIKFYLDDVPHGRLKSNQQLIGDVEIGEHTIYAQLIEKRSRKIVKTSPVVKFYVE